jgi:hypothetical protein
MINNPEHFCNQHKKELIEDLKLTPSLCCPKCIVNYIDNTYEDSCRLEEIEENMELVCQFDYYDTKIETIIKYWITDVLKQCYEVGGIELYDKWIKKFNVNPNDEDYYTLKKINKNKLAYRDYDDEHFKKFVEYCKKYNHNIDRNYLNLEELDLLTTNSSK